MGVQISVVMRHQAIDNPWISHQWKLDAVSVDVGQYAEMTLVEHFSHEGTKAFKVSDNPQDSKWLYTGFHLDVYADEAEGYYLNVSSQEPCWFVMWRLEWIDALQQEIAVPQRVMLSYNEAARLLDGGEQVDQLPLDPLILESLQQFVAENYRPEVKKRHRPESFKGAARGLDERSK
jgi:Protein of unknown function (DUF3305)